MHVIGGVDKYTYEEALEIAKFNGLDEDDIGQLMRKCDVCGAWVFVEFDYITDNEEFIDTCVACAEGYTDHNNYEDE